ncbi:MAG: hypothetical protein HYT87_08235 [Nitrospirae bacterium]|nr:hypothetical protein [Nitrospirota bacterium]
MRIEARKENCKDDVTPAISVYRDQAYGFAGKILSELAHFPEKPPPLTADAATRLNAAAGTALSATSSLCIQGYSHVAPVIVRNMLEIALGWKFISEEDHAFRAFKFLSFEILHLAKEKGDDAVAKEFLDEFLSRMGGARDRSRAVELAKSFNLGTRPSGKTFNWKYWFATEDTDPRGPSALVSRFSRSAEQSLKLYGILSRASHGTFGGQAMFQDDGGRVVLGPLCNPHGANLWTLQATSAYLALASSIASFFGWSWSTEVGALGAAGSVLMEGLRNGRLGKYVEE